MAVDQTMIDRLLFVRRRAIQLNDHGLFREVNHKLAQIGWRPDATPAEVEVAEGRAEADARPADRPTAVRDTRPARKPGTLRPLD